MRLTKKYIATSMGQLYFTGRKDVFTFNIYTQRSGDFYVHVTRKTGLRYNSLWDGIKFPTIEDATTFCENFMSNILNYSTKQ